MNTKEYILNEIEALTLESSLKSVQNIFQRLPITHIPIVEKGKLIGCISESYSNTIEDDAYAISEYSNLIELFFADKNIAILNLIKLFSDNESNLMPVINDKKQYLGYYELNDILDLFCSSPFIFSDGIIINIEKNKKDFSTSEVSQIVESNDGEILGIYISSNLGDKKQAIIKISSDDINEIIQTFRRYDYIVMSEHEDDFYLQDLKERSDYLQKYLNM
tara:strand:- start:35234 stop:35893 length:660 start_codon:yes stop_codon:yes gene_type:complete